MERPASGVNTSKSTSRPTAAHKFHKCGRSSSSAVPSAFMSRDCNGASSLEIDLAAAAVGDGLAYQRRRLKVLAMTRVIRMRLCVCRTNWEICQIRVSATSRPGKMARPARLVYGPLVDLRHLRGYRRPHVVGHCFLNSGLAHASTACAILEERGNFRNQILQ